MKLKLAAQAERDIAGILLYTEGTFGETQLAKYRALIQDALARIEANPKIGTTRRETGLLRYLHVSQPGRHGRHFVIYDLPNDEEVEVLRVLHDAMDFQRHLEE